jgi:hypothetical protein
MTTIVSGQAAYTGLAQKAPAVAGQTVYTALFYGAPITYLQVSEQTAYTALISKGGRRRQCQVT